MSFLAVDVGNTRLKWALYDAARPNAELLAQGAVFLEMVDQLSDNDWKPLPRPSSMLGCVVASEGVKRRVSEQIEDLWNLEPRWVVSTAQAAGVRNGYDHPNRLGVDRWVALIAARQRVLASGQPRAALVVMVGTAVTVDALDADGLFVGGLILPGFGLMLRAGDGHCRVEGTDRRGRRLSHPHQRRFDERRRACDRRRHRAHAPPVAGPGGSCSAAADDRRWRARPEDRRRPRRG
jgi:hypothetical protein